MKLPYKVGRFQFCSLNIDLFLVEGASSWFEPHPNDTDCPQMCIGVDLKEWWRVLHSFLHEAEEATLVFYGYSFSPTSSSIGDSTIRTFIFSHGGLVRVNEEVAFFVSNALPVLERKWKKYKGVKE